MKIKPLYTSTAIIEVATGLALVAAPVLPISLLTGTVMDMPAGLIVGRVAGAALFTLGFVCWRARNDIYSPSANGIVAGMFIYNIAVAAILAYGNLVMGLFGVALWPVVVVHVLMAFWCAGGLILRER